MISGRGIFADFSRCYRAQLKKKELAEARQNSVEGVISRVKESGVTLALRNDEEIPFGFESRCWLYLRLAVHQLTVESN